MTEIITLENGLRIIFEEGKNSKTCGAEIWTASGSSYETPESIKMLEDTVDVYLADFKFYTSTSASELAMAEDYPEAAKAAIYEMVKQRPNPEIIDGVMKKGVIVRVLLLPGHVAEAKLIVNYLYKTYGNSIYISLMSQYTPMPDAKGALARRVSSSEYRELVDYAIGKGITQAFTQEGGCAEESFIPPFDLTGVK